MARALLGLGCMLGACILPPEGIEPATEINRPPLLLLEAQRPAPLEFINLGECDLFRAEAEVVDLDDATLRFRWVANDGLPGTNLLDADARSATPGAIIRLSQRVVPPSDFNVPRDASQVPAILSLFVTDATLWADEDPDPYDPNVAANLGLIPESQRATAFVVEARWALVFDAAVGGCP